MLLGATPGWIYGRDPVGELRFEALLARLRAAVASDPRLLPNLLRAHLLAKAHRLTLHMVPDAAFNDRCQAAERAQLTPLVQL